MGDEDLEYWGEFGRLLTWETMGLQRQPPDIIKLWNLFGALEAKVRNGNCGN